ncbi:MAG: S41 family peptidase, partial [Planctomycetota bacterium]
PSNGQFGNILASIDAQDLRGQTIRYQFDARIEQGRCHLQGWLRVDRESQQRGLFDNMNDRRILSESWSNYEITGKIDDDAERLVLGVMFFGSGSALIDNVRLEVKEGDQWETVDSLANQDFEQGDDQPESWTQTTNGYAIELENEDVSSGKQSVRLLRKTFIQKGRKVFDLIPELGELIDVEIHPGLRLRMPLSLETSKNHKTNSAINLDQWLFKVNKTSTDNAKQNVASIANAILLWSTFQHFYPYFEQVETDWEMVLAKSLQNAIDAGNDREKATKNLQWIVAQLHDGHGNVLDTQSRDLIAPVKFDWIENRLIVTASDDNQLQVGDIVTQIDGQDSVVYIKNLEQYISGSPQWKRVRSLQSLSRGQQPKKLKVIRQTKKVDVELQFKGRQPLKIDEGEVCRVEVDQKDDSEDIWYIDMGRAGPKDINGILSDLAKAKGVVLDFRGYPRGTQYLFQHMTDEHMQSQKWQVPQQIHPDRVDMQTIKTNGRWQMPPKKPRFQGTMVFLTNGSAISYAESCMAIVANYKLGEIIGSPTAGANGNINPFSLPGGYRIIFTGMRVMNHDDSQHHIYGVPVTIPMQPTIEGTLAGRDELLEAAIQLIKD